MASHSFRRGYALKGSALRVPGVTSETESGGVIRWRRCGGNPPNTGVNLNDMLRAAFLEEAWIGRRRGRKGEAKYEHHRQREPDNGSPRQGPLVDSHAAMISRPCAAVNCRRPVSDWTPCSATGRSEKGNRVAHRCRHGHAHSFPDCRSVHWTRGTVRGGGSGQGVRTTRSGHGLQPWPTGAATMVVVSVMVS